MLIQAHVVADDGRLPDHDSGSVIDEETSPDVRGGVDVDPRLRAAQLRDDAGDERDPEHVQAVRQTVMHHRVDTGIADQDFGHAACRRVAGVRHADVGDQQVAQSGKTIGEPSHDLVAVGFHDLSGLTLELQFRGHFAAEATQGGLQHPAHVSVDVGSA